MSGNGKKSIEQVFREGTPIDDAAREAVQDALWRHKQAGNPICVWRDGQIVWIPPEEIPVERPPSSAAAADPLAGEGL